MTTDLRRDPGLRPGEARLAAVLRGRRPRGLRLFAAGAVALVPWTALLVMTLPTEHQVHQWSVAWAGFDVLLILALTATAVLGWRRHPAGILAAAVTAALLICDAWFDVSLDIGSPDIWGSAALALFVELPVATFLIHRVYTVFSAMVARIRAQDDGSSSC